MAGFYYVALAILLIVAACARTDTDTVQTCELKCVDCTHVELKCTRSKENEHSEITPTN